MVKLVLYMRKFVNEFRGSNGVRRDRASWWRCAEEEGCLEDRVILIIPDRPAPTITLQNFSLLVLVFMVFKAGAIAWLGQEAYLGALAVLEAGTVFEQIAAFLMGPDLLSQFIVENLFL